MKGFHVHADEDDGWRCRKHPAAQPRTGGVCPVCLRARLLRLCPDCAGERPCGCSSSSCPSTSSSSLSSLDIPRSAADAAGARVGAVGRVVHLIDTEPAFRRSRSAVFHLLWPRQDDVAAPAFRHANAVTLQHPDGGGGWLRLWRFQRGKKEAAEEGAERDAAGAARLSRSRSVGLAPGAYPDPGGIRAAVGGGADVRGKAWNRYFPSPMKAFRHRKTSKVVEARSPLCRG